MTDNALAFAAGGIVVIVALALWWIVARYAGITLYLDGDEE